MSQFPSTVKALTFAKTGGIEVLEKTERPFPQQGPRDVILKVRPATIPPSAAAGNSTDCYRGCRSSMPG